MLAILLTILGVPLWLVLGGVGAGLWSRRSFRKSPGVFAVKARVVDSAAPLPKWKRKASYARWVHDVLIVHQGLGLVRNRALPVASASPATISSDEVEGSATIRSQSVSASTAVRWSRSPLRRPMETR